ncbi:MAG: trypsin-like serine protease [Acidobacteriota bacterium]|nr:trypsin-like serine protease [Acidobacteriota bacterium]
MNDEYHRSLGSGELDVRTLTDDERAALHDSRPAEELFDTPPGLGTDRADIAASDAMAAASPRTPAQINLYPFRAVVYLKVMRQQGFPIRGTGFFVSERVLVTAAHNLPADLTSISVYVKLNGTTSGPPFVTTDRRVNPGFASNTRGDYGAVIIEERVGEATGWFVIPTNPSAPAAGSIIEMSGYPSPGFRQLRGSGPIVSVDSQTLLYGIDTEFGDSGAPIWIDTAPFPLLVGIHRAENGIAVPITAQVSQRIRGWISEAP